MKRYLKLKYFLGYLKVIFYKVKYFNCLSLNGFRYYFARGVVLEIKRGKIKLADKVYFSKGVEVYCEDSQIIIGKNCFFNKSVNIMSLDRVTIGDNCLFGPNVNIIDHNHIYSNPDIPICKQGLKKSSISIGNDVWIATNVVITAGSKIGDRVIVGANSVVIGELASNGLYCGNPAQLIKKI